MRITKKVLLFLVEGPTDADALEPALKKCFQEQNVRFHIVYGDLTADQNISSQNAVQTVYRHIKSVVERLRITRRIKSFDYMLLYFSRNMEHVLQNEPRQLTREEKVNYADMFAEQYGAQPEAFKEFICRSDFAVKGDYIETWEFILDGTHSLHRYSNLHLLFLTTS